MVPLSDVASVRTVDMPVVIQRFNLSPMVEITASPTAGVSLAQARKLCESAAEEVRMELGLATKYQLAWLEKMPAAR
jgi:multidrug efflux pump subunit AcrB